MGWFMNVVDGKGGGKGRGHQAASACCECVEVVNERKDRVI